MSTTTTISDPATVEEQLAVQALLYREARLLDDRNLDAWVELFTQDARYHLPIEISDDPREPSLIKDDRAGMEERVFRLTKTLAHAQNPPSRTQHDLSNIEVEALAGGGYLVRCHQNVHELRTGDVNHVGLGERRVFAARCEYELVPSDSGLRIRRKTCLLIDREYPMYNLTFIF